MSTVAEQLRHARESRQLTIDQVAELTKIRTDRIRALEAGEYNSFSATIYIRGSVKNYARALKLDEAKLLGVLDAELKGTEKFSEPPPITTATKSPVDRALFLLSKVNVKVVMAAGGVLAVFLILGIAHWVLKNHKPADPLANLQPAVYQPASSGDTLPLPKK